MIQSNDCWNNDVQILIEMKRISECIFAVEVDGKRFNISVERLKPACFTAQQEEHLINKSITVQPSTETSLLKNTHSILKIYPSEYN